MDISIIIVSWNVEDLLRKCLKSVYDNRGDLNIEVFVVDNISSDNSVDMVKREFPQVKLIANEENVGFARANNQAIKQAIGDYVLLLNPDTEIFPQTLEKSIKFVNDHPDCGVMGCNMVYGDGSSQSSVRRFPGIWPIFLMLLKLPKFFPNLKSINHYLATDFDYSKEQVVDQVMGAYMFMKKEVIEKVGMMDERFFIWFEEVDFCKRMYEGDYKVYYTPDIKIIHHGGKSFAQQKMIRNQKIFFSSAMKYFLKRR